MAGAWGTGGILDQTPTPDLSCQDFRSHGDLLSGTQGRLSLWNSLKIIMFQFGKWNPTIH